MKVLRFFRPFVIYYTFRSLLTSIALWMWNESQKDVHKTYDFHKRLSRWAEDRWLGHTGTTIKPGRQTSLLPSQAEFIASYLSSVWIPMLRSRQQCTSQYSCGLWLGESMLPGRQHWFTKPSPQLYCEEHCCLVRNIGIQKDGPQATILNVFSFPCFEVRDNHTLLCPF